MTGAVKKIMRSIKVFELKDNLDQFLSKVQQGEDLEIRYRNKPIAKLVPLLSADDDDLREARLEAAGKLRRRKRSLPALFLPSLLPKWRWRKP